MRDALEISASFEALVEGCGHRFFSPQSEPFTPSTWSGVLTAMIELSLDTATNYPSLHAFTARTCYDRLVNIRPK